MRVFLMVLGCVYFDMNHNTRVYSPCGEKGDHLRGCECVLWLTVVPSNGREDVPLLSACRILFPILCRQR